MNYPISPPVSESTLLPQSPVIEELILSAIAGVITNARSQGRSLEEIKAEVMEDDSLLDVQQRYWLSEAVAQAWEVAKHEAGSRD
ncbi:MAG: hypothetical protein KME18_23515 [Phormidium tanganyikae FI6-MK23]|jgi:hypothetical protein|nr:hypothetical protein [Phormidium tanganyikae FI6-MK23]